MKNKASKNKFMLYLLIAFMLVAAANAFTTSGSGKTASIAITSGKNAQSSGPKFLTYMVVGDVTGTINSSSFKNYVGFLNTVGFLDGERCLADVECAGGFCCSDSCQSSKCLVPQAAPEAVIVSSGDSGPIPNATPDYTYTHVFDSISAGQDVTVTVSKDALPITKIEFTLKESLSDVSLSIAPVEAPSSTIQDSIQYFEIQSNKINSGNLASLAIYFKVGISLGYIKDTVSLNRFDVQWVKLPTVLISEDNEYYYYKSSAQSFSLFAITGSKYPPAQVIKQVVVQPNVTVQEQRNVTPQLQVIPEEAARKEAGLKRTLLIFGIFAWLAISAVLVIYVLPKLRVHHIKKVYENFNSLLFEANAGLVSENVDDASKIYKKLLKMYISLIHYPIDMEIKISMYAKTKQIYDQIARMRNGGFKI